jgi:hypothetical protein
MGKVKIIKEAEKDKFTKSDCVCEFCVSMNQAQLDWCDFEIKNELQKNMKRVIAKIENREKLKKLKK